MKAANELKSLYRDYSRGLITREQYRASRAGVLDAAPNEYAETDAEDEDITRPREAPAAQATPETAGTAAVQSAPGKPSSTGSRWKLLAAVPLLAVAALVAWFVYRDFAGPADTAGVPPSRAQVPADAGVPAQADRAKSLARKFLFANDWSEESVREFVAAWTALTPEERAAAERSVWMPGLVETVRRYVQEERSLLAAAGLPAEVSESLAELAVVFGIEADDLPIEAGQAGSVARADVVPKDSATPAAPGPREAERVAAVAPAAAAAPPPAPAPPTAEEPATRVSADVGPSTGKLVDEAADAGPLPDKCPASLVRKKERFCRDVLASGQPGPLLVVVPPGKFRMGSDLGAEESPSHDVSLARPIAIGVHEVSVDEYRTFCESAGHSCPESQGSAGDLPMVMISWRDAVAYADWLSAQTGHEYRLPSESEWEYAARGGTQTRFPFGDEMTSADAAFSGLRPRKAPAPRSERFNRNGFSLYHAVGNVREWVQDDWSPTYAGAPVDGSPRRGSTSEKVVRGGSFADGFDGVRSSSRRPLGGATKDPYTGFRVVREIR